MKLDYTYCINRSTCIHRIECRRWIGNYEDEDVIELYTKSRYIEEIDDKYCMEKDFVHIDRFRNSIGEERC